MGSRGLETFLTSHGLGGDLKLSMGFPGTLKGHLSFQRLLMEVAGVCEKRGAVVHRSFDNCVL